MAFPGEELVREGMTHLAMHSASGEGRTLSWSSVLVWHLLL